MGADRRVSGVVESEAVSRGPGGVQARVEDVRPALAEVQGDEADLRVQNEALRRAQRELAADRERFRHLFLHAPDACLVTDPGGVIREANAAAGALLGVTPRRLAGKPLATYVAVAERRRWRRELLRRVQTREPRGWEFELTPPLGPPVPVLASLTPLPSIAAGEVLLRWLLRDQRESRRVAEQARLLERERAARERLQLAHSELESVVSHLPMGILLAEAPGGRLLTYNRAMEEILGFPPPLADSIAEYSQAYTGYYPDGRAYAPAEWPLARALTAGEVVVDEEILFVRPDGTRMIGRVSAAPVRGEDGAITAAIAVISDITGRRLQDERRELLGEVSDVLNASPDFRETVHRLAALCAEAMGDFCLVHLVEGGAARVVGFAHRDPQRVPLLREVLRAFPLEPESAHPILEVIRVGEPRLLPSVPQRMAGVTVETAEQAELVRRLDLCSVMVVPIRTGGRTLGTITFARTGNAHPFGSGDLRLAEEVAARAAHAVDHTRLFRAAQSSAQARDEVLSVVSHDLRNSLNAALMNTDLLLEIDPAFRQGTRQHRQMEAVRRSLHHMHRLVQDLLEVDRIERGSLSMHLARLAPAALAQELLELFGSVAHAGQVELRVEVAPDTPPVLADHARLVQVFGNLIGNAVRYSDAGGTVRVSAEAEAEHVRFLVTDTGCGIPAADLPHVFDRFFQARRHERVGRGSGLGLAITRGIVEAHGGRIGVRSREGEGSTFWFTLPRAPAPGAGA